MAKITAFFVIIAYALSCGVYGFRPTVEVDASKEVAPIGHYASGYLYGLAEPGVPEPDIVDSLAVSSAAQKVLGGLQHPIGDVDDVYGSLREADYITVYLQDAYSTWYYDESAILESRRAGTYDAKEYVENDFFPKVRSAVSALKDRPYSDRLVYCPYNECDNGVWFGTFEDGRCLFDEAGANAFFEGWRDACSLIRSIDSDAKIGGPGYYEYNYDKLKAFLTYCRDNGCLPDVMIYHELNGSEGYNSANLWGVHAEEYRQLEKELGIAEIPVVVTEYGSMEQCGNGAEMFRYVYQAENSGFWGDIAYWRLADNLCDNTADGVEPNSCWWLYRKYAAMTGSRLELKVKDLFHSDFGKAVKEGRELRFKHLNGLAASSAEGDEISVIVSGADYDGRVKIKNLAKAGFGKKVGVTVEAVTFEGLSGAVYRPYTLQKYNASLCGGSVSVKLDDMDINTVYFVTVGAAHENIPEELDELPERYEFERGTLLGGAYVYDSAYATTGDVQGMVGGMENVGDGVKISFNSCGGRFRLKFIYGKANDGSSPDGRVTGRCAVTIDGKAYELKLPNTIKSEYTGAVTLETDLAAGEHVLTAEHLDGTFVLDSLLVEKAEDTDEIYVSRQTDTEYYAVLPRDGYYNIETDSDYVKCMGTQTPPGETYLRRGVVKLETDGSEPKITKAEDCGAYAVVRPEDASLSGASVENGLLCGIGSSGGEASFTVGADEGGEYRFAVTYSNNREGGYHAYNVDLIETYITVSCGNQTKNVWCRSTYSSENFTTAVFTLTLNEGENTVRLFNDGSVKFDGRESFAPEIKEINVFKAYKGG